MRIKGALSSLLIVFVLSLIACRGAGIRSAEITCTPSSKITSSVGKSGMITIVWSSNKEPDLAGYKIFYGTASGSYKSCVDVGKPGESSPGITEYALSGLTKGKKW